MPFTPRLVFAYCETRLTVAGLFLFPTTSVASFIAPSLDLKSAGLIRLRCELAGALDKKRPLGEPCGCNA